MTNEESVAGCLQCPAHPAVLELINSNTKAIRWFIGTFLTVVVFCLLMFWVAYIQSSDVDRQFQSYVAGNAERLKNIERMIERNERVLGQIDERLRENDRKP